MMMIYLGKSKGFGRLEGKKKEDRLTAVDRPSTRNDAIGLQGVNLQAIYNRKRLDGSMMIELFRYSIFLIVGLPRECCLYFIR